MNNKLTVTVETGELKTIIVHDILESYAHEKSFIIYSFEDNPAELYGSILNEREEDFSLDTITNPDEIKYISAEIDRVANELINEEENKQNIEGV